MKTVNNQPLKRIVANYYINLIALVEFLRNSDEFDEWEKFNAIFYLDKKVEEKHDFVSDIPDPDMKKDLIRRYKETKHRLCIVRDCMLKPTDPEDSIEVIKEIFEDHQRDEEKPLQLTCLMAIVEALIRPQERSVQIMIGGMSGSGYGLPDELIEILRRNSGDD